MTCCWMDHYRSLTNVRGERTISTERLTRSECSSSAQARRGAHRRTNAADLYPSGGEKPIAAVAITVGERCQGGCQGVPIALPQHNDDQPQSERRNAVYPFMKLYFGQTGSITGGR